MKFQLFALLAALLFSPVALASPAVDPFDSADLNTPKGEPLRITRATPSGQDVPAGRQIVFQFNRAVVPLGRMERQSDEIPVEISPPLACQWRWLNTSALACQLDEKNALREATKYRIVMKPGIRAEDGGTISEPYTHHFITARPQITYTLFDSWESPGTPVLRLVLNQPVTRASAEKNLSFTYHKIGADKAYVTHDIEVKPFPYDHDTPVKTESGEARRIWLVSPRRELPLDTQIKLKVKPGLVSAIGPEKGIGDRDVLSFHTFPEFAFLGVICTRNDGERILITGKNTKTAGECNPLQGVALSFSSPVPPSQVKENIQLTPDLAGGRKDYDPWANHRDHSQLHRAHQKGNSYDIWLPERLKAAQDYSIKSGRAAESGLQKLASYFSQTPSSKLHDEFGRTLTKPVKLAFRTDHRPPDFELPHPTAVLEQQVDSDMPLYVTNLDSVTVTYDALTPKGKKEQQTLSLKDIGEAEDIQYAVPMQIRDTLQGQSGAVFGSVETQPPVGKPPFHHQFFALVSPYQLHVKAGHYNTLVWVTDLATGQPVQNAKVRIYTDRINDLSAPATPLDTAQTDASGLASLKGNLDLDPELKLLNWCREGYNACERLFVRIDKDGEMALMPLEPRFEINTYRASNNSIWPSSHKQYGHIHAWGTTAQGIYRAGNTIQYKFYVRNQDNDAYVPAPQEGYTLHIIDPTGKTVHEVKELTLSEFGSHSGEYTVPETAAVGWYQFHLSADFTKDYSWQPMRVLVSDFTPSPFKVTAELNGDLFHPGDEVEASSHARLHSGGAYMDAETRVTATLKAAHFSSKHPVASGFSFDSYSAQSSQDIFQKTAPINEKGDISHRFTLPESPIIYGRLTVESAVRDDRGKYIAASAGADFAAVDRLVGLKSTKWLYEEDKPAEIRYLVVDEQGTPTSGTPVALTIERLHTRSSKVKGAGNTYLTHYVDEWQPAGSCAGTSENAAKTCAFTPEEPGSYRITASIKDTQGHAHSTQMQIWVAGKGRVVWHTPDDHSLQIIPEKTDYTIGETARYLIKNPYPGAQALITIERYGVLKSWVQTLDGSTPVIAFEIEKDFMPGFYLSITAMSPRADAPLPPMGQVDLGKPAFKIGYLTVPVKDPYKQIDVSITTDAEIYKPREKVTATIHAAPKHKDKKEKIELAVAVLDEAVLDLVLGGADYFDPYQGFYRLDGLDLRNYSLLTQLIGRQKFEKKGADPGGDGGTDISVRNKEKTLAYWNPSIVMEDAETNGRSALLNAPPPLSPAPQKADANGAGDIDIRAQIEESIYWADSVRVNHKGEAEIQFRLPDNLTGWRILALATTPTDRMGLGQTNFKVNRLTEIRPVMPNQVTEGDEFRAGFSVMNRTGEERQLTVKIEVRGPMKPLEIKLHDGTLDCGPFDAYSAQCIYQRTLTLAPYKRETVYMPIETAPLKERREEQTGTLAFTAKAFDKTDGDGVEHRLPVHKRRSLEVAANYGTTTKEQIRESIAFPENIHPDIGELSVALSPSVIGNVAGAFRYIRDYPYSCWEQKLTKGVMASHFLNLKDYLPDDLIWEESASLPETTLKQAANYQAPNGGMAYFVPSDRYVSPYLSAYTALAFTWLRESGHAVPTAVEDRLHEYLVNLLKQDAVPDFYSAGMTSTVRAVALAALAKQGKIKQKDLERYRSHMPRMSLFGKAQYLQAALEVEGAEPLAAETAEAILAHSSQSGGKFSFNETLDDGYAQILATPLRTNCGILSALTAYAKQPNGAAQTGDVPFKLVRSVTQTRGNRDHWENTQENIFCLNGLIDYARRYESTKPDMRVSAALDEQPFGETAFRDVRDEMVTFSRPITAKDPGTTQELTLSREGDGRLYYATRLRYAPRDDHAERVNAGIDIHREYSVERNGTWTLLDNPGEIKRGELVRVDIYLSLPTARHFVVVDDPVPGGLEPVNRDLATASLVDADKGNFQAAESSWWFRFNDWKPFGSSHWSFYHKELRHDAVRFYSDYLPPGRYHLSYTAQAIAEGAFTRMPVHAEEMYDPDVYGKGLPGVLRIGDADIMP